MRKNLRFSLIGAIFCFFLFGSFSSWSQTKITKTDADKKIAELVQKMTLQEKVGQMAQITLDVITKGNDRFSSFEPVALDPVAMKKAFEEYKIGSVLNTANNRARTPQVWYQLITQIQDAGKGRLNIPVVYGIDAIHGATYTVGATFFPQQIGQAASRNRELVKKAAQITAYETRASGIPWSFSPVLDLGPDPRFPRIWETYGEDPYLDTQLGVQVIKGYEGENNNVSDPFHVASCLKHFLGYQVAFSGKDRTPAIISDQQLREYHLPAFKAAIDAGAHSIMINSGLINGIPVHANPKILTQLLRNELGFKGLVVTDWGDIENLYKRDRIARNNKEAVMIAINAGVDMSMIAYQYEPFCDDLVALVKEGKVKQSRIDDAVTHILKFKYELGLFETPVTNFKDYPKFGSKEFEQAAYQTAAESITLLKNKDNVLPLNKGLKVLVTGPNANSMRTLNGGWTYSWQGEKVEEFAAKYNTILEAMQNKIGAENVKFVPGVSYKMDGKYFEEYADQMEKAIDEAKEVDVVILCLGENTYTETPGNLSDLYLSDLQTEFAKKIAAAGKKVILVLNEGRPRIISKFEPMIPAIIDTYLPGNFGGDALADILFGDVNPSGKLPFNYPKFPNSLANYDHKPSESRAVVEGVYNYDADYNPQFEFGFGLSYTTFKYSNLKISADKISANDILNVSVQVSNTGNKEGKEVVDLYLSDLYASISPDVKRLKGFEKINLMPGETKTVTFKLTKEELSFINADLKKVVEPGDFEIQIGDLKKTFMVE
ncbi:MAG: glycoside hydrolase family 3 C-terminal domain-containing protein [Bacteroidetes bacterium]|nr:glycoside hydrolase family 3 C-terminal domain-containing protein [Bacteroidota bacterium]MBU1373163.1 glycoside hydrolase family 3 C-terminal domain-containing protein [Bacteroidota bacterium]MBU1484345.1 glycoside hydrolase family 3 C-terminal domain-containing protein [Bacteroidota bacterium]MBU1761745.1 glycoside hydrolase family 3 C-terminal domain-containing protein [Bacteroidota bacterium]MBU2266788.1 glycoside hydrolase family 3 C-terminal domain-containing protein [Bacteroidota bact